jgi:transcriptional repressor NrdR
MVIKKDGRREPYSHDKLLIGIQKSLEKRPVSQERIEKVVAKVEKKLQELGDKEIPTVLIGELVMKELKKVDSVAYIRFASVYREFKDISDFKKELKRIT